MIDDNTVKYEVVDITPDVASSMLDGKNTHNRNVRQSVVERYARDMQDGNWYGENGQSIVIADDQRIVDGQHRLWAIILSETTQRMLVVSGVPMSAQANVDTNERRMFRDVLKLRGEQRAGMLAAIVRRVAVWEAGYRRKREAVSYARMLDTLDRHPNLRRIAPGAASVQRRVPMSGSTAGLCHWLFEAIDEDDAEHFMALLRGEHDGLPRQHPVRALVETLSTQNVGKSRLNDTTVTAYVIKAWNAYRRGEPVAQLRYRPGGANPEKFPEPT